VYRFNKIFAYARCQNYPQWSQATLTFQQTLPGLLGFFTCVWKTFDSDLIIFTLQAPICKRGAPFFRYFRQIKKNQAPARDVLMLGSNQCGCKGTKNVSVALEGLSQAMRH
jgi:hypothetical protein